MPYGSKFAKQHRQDMRKWRYGLMMRKATRNVDKMNQAYILYKNYDKAVGKNYGLSPWGSNWKRKAGPVEMIPQQHDAHVRARRIRFLEGRRNRYQKLGSYLKRKYEDDLIRDIIEYNR